MRHLTKRLTKLITCGLLAGACSDPVSSEIEVPPPPAPGDPSAWKDVAAFAEHACALDKEGNVFCWGDGYGWRPAPVAEGLVLDRLAQNQCGLTSEGLAFCWGGTLGSSPTPVLPEETIVSLSRGYNHTCAVVENGTVKCWGLDIYAELGTGKANGFVADPTPVSGSYVSVSAKSFYTCAIGPDGRAHCWGHNYFAQLGRRTTETCGDGGQSDDPCGKTPGPVSGDLVFSSLDVGGYHSCGIGPGGTAFCWGTDVFSVLGSDEAAERCTQNEFPCTYDPVPVGKGIAFADVHTSGVFSCARTAVGEVYCWGSNYYGQLGDGKSNAEGLGGASRDPVPLTGELTFARISLGENHGCGLTTTGSIYCWGSNSRGQLGAGQRPNSNTPLRVLDPE